MSEVERVFTVEEANAMLADLAERLTRIRDARRIVIETARLVHERVEADGGGVAGEPAYFEAARTLRTEIEHLAEVDVVLRDPETGLVDFLGEVDGRRVWLCWRLGEDRVAHYHELDSGFVGRKPL
ncbi:MAG TPA: DUF2203 domain-containing protein [Actinomycetota bacterium]|nr:DUF2203 domain-containing protein [Actinomycetota bacterium]